jgi:hypothetical protein
MVWYGILVIIIFAIGFLLMLMGDMLERSYKILDGQHYIKKWRFGKWIKLEDTTKDKKVNPNE